MYSIFDRKSAIKEVQRYLRAVTDAHVSESGIYDDGTKKSVIAFQKKHGLPENGIVDKETFSLLYLEYKKSFVSDMNFPILYGSYGSVMKKINKRMRILLNYYGVHHSLRSSAYYSEETEKSVEILRQMYNLEQKEGIDQELYERLMKDTENITYK